MPADDATNKPSDANQMVRMSAGQIPAPTQADLDRLEAAMHRPVEPTEEGETTDVGPRIRRTPSGKMLGRHPMPADDVTIKPPGNPNRPCWVCGAPSVCLWLRLIDGWERASCEKHQPGWEHRGERLQAGSDHSSSDERS